MILMLLSPMWGLNREMKENFKHLVHETWPRMCGRITFKFYKKQTNSENHEICQDLMISYVEAVVKNWECFAQFYMYDCLQNEASPKKNRTIEKNLIRFGVKVTVELGFDFKTFCMGNRQHRFFFMWNFGIFWIRFIIFIF